jgi:hypothetical protein
MPQCLPHNLKLCAALDGMGCEGMSERNDTGIWDSCLSEIFADKLLNPPGADPLFKLTQKQMGIINARPDT